MLVTLYTKLFVVEPLDPVPDWELRIFPSAQHGRRVLYHNISSRKIKTANFSKVSAEYVPHHHKVEKWWVGLLDHRLSVAGNHEDIPETWPPNVDRLLSTAPSSCVVWRPEGGKRVGEASLIVLTCKFQYEQRGLSVIRWRAPLWLWLVSLVLRVWPQLFRWLLFASSHRRHTGGAQVMREDTEGKAPSVCPLENGQGEGESFQTTLRGLGTILVFGKVGGYDI